jgi:AcrR family transcriptional regulator
MARLDAARVRELHAATLDVLVDLGFDRLSMDLVATRAHASKATLYRHWPNKEALVVEALESLARDHRGSDEVPDTGSLREDLRALIRQGNDQGPQLDLVTAVIHACRAHPELAALVREQVVLAHVAVLDSILQRAVARGEIDADSPALRFALISLVGPKLLHDLVDDTGTDEQTYLFEYVDAVLLPALGAR